MYALRKRLSGYFVLLHTESRQKHHHMKHKDGLKKHHDHQKAGRKDGKRSLHDITIETEARKSMTNYL